MDRDDRIRYLEDKLDELRRDRKATIAVQCGDKSKSPSFDDYVAELRRQDRVYERYAIELEKLTGRPQQKHL